MPKAEKSNMRKIVLSPAAERLGKQLLGIVDSYKELDPADEFDVFIGVLSRRIMVKAKAVKGSPKPKKLARIMRRLSLKPSNAMWGVLSGVRRCAHAIKPSGIATCRED